MTKTLGDFIIELAIAYYEMDDPLVSYMVYDTLWSIFNQTEEEHPLITTKGEKSSSLYYVTAKQYLDYKNGQT